MSRPVKVYITRYAFSKGIQEATGIIRQAPKTSRSHGYEHCLYQLRGIDHTLEARKGQYHLTLEAAVAEAEKMRTAEIASLNRKIDALESKDFMRDFREEQERVA